MKAVNVVKTAVWIALLAGVSAAAGMKFVAVVETELDAGSDAPDKITKAEVRQITAELRRQAVNNLLPRDKYTIMTAETVIAQGGAVLEECAEENCVITLGARIGADYIVRGIVSTFRTKLTLTVEMYETENGNLVASSEAVRSENPDELLEMAATVCADMYKKFVETQNIGQKPTVAAADTAVVQQPEPRAEPTAKPKKEKRAPKPKPEPKPKPAPKPIEWPPIKLSAGGGVFFASDFGGGLAWERSGEALAMPYYGGGAYLFYDANYIEVFAGISGGGGTWKSADAVEMADRLPDASRSCVNIGLFAKYPVGAENIKLFPLLGIDYEASISGKLVYNNGMEIEPGKSTSAAWFKIGGGADLGISGAAYLRVELLYGWRTANEFENILRNQYAGQYPDKGVKTRLGNGLTLKAGVGVK